MSHYFDDCDDVDSLPIGAVLDVADRRADEVAEEVAARVVPTGLPHATDAERALIGGLLLDPSAIDRAEDEGLTPEDFYRRQHGRLYAAVLAVAAAGDPVDVLTVCARLEATGELEEVGGRAYVASLEAAMPTSAHVGAYARLIRDAATRRRLIEAGTAIVREAHRGGKPVTDLVDEAERAVLAVGDGASSSASVDIRVLVHEAIDDLERAYKAKRVVTGLPSGIDELDQITTGFQPGELIIIAARPSMGKTAYALRVTAQAALRCGVDTQFWSLEMRSRQLVQRLIASEAKIDLQALRRGHVPGDAWIRMAEVTGELGESPLHIEESVTLRVSDIRSRARRLKQERGLGLIVVDYLQLMHGQQRQGQNKADEVGEISRGLKSLALELDVPVIALSQLNRGVESRSDKRPGMADLRDSGAVEQDADVILFLYREDYYLRDKCPEDTKGTAEIIVAKNRNGPIGTAKARFLPQFTRFENLEAERDEYAP